MRNTCERVAAIEKRTGELKRQQEKRRSTITIILASAASFALIIITALTLAGSSGLQGNLVNNGSRAAGIFAAGSASGYVLIGILAFALGCCVTILCYRIRHRNPDQKES